MSGFGKRVSSPFTPAPLPPAVLEAEPPAHVPAPEPSLPRSDAPPIPARTEAHPATDFIRGEVLQRIEPAVAVQMTQGDLATRVNGLVAEIATAVEEVEAMPLAGGHITFDVDGDVVTVGELPEGLTVLPAGR